MSMDTKQVERISEKYIGLPFIVNDTLLAGYIRDEQTKSRKLLLVTLIN